MKQKKLPVLWDIQYGTLLFFNSNVSYICNHLASSRLKRSANHLWNNSDVGRKKFCEWSPLSIAEGRDVEIKIVDLITFAILCFEMLWKNVVQYNVVVSSQHNQHSI
jgi:superfamily I DNA and/or RNA helicase